MPQLDKFIILNQFKCFVICFLIVYLFFVVVILPKVNLSLRMRKSKLIHLNILISKWIVFKTLITKKTSHVMDLILNERTFIELQSFLFLKNKVIKVVGKIFNI